MPDGVTDFIKDNKTAEEGIGSTIASIGLAKLGEEGAGSLVSPAIWVLKGKAPDAVSFGLWGVGLIGDGLLGAAAAATGVVKSLVDNETDKELAAVRAAEPRKYAPFIKACVHYDYAGQGINAMTIASRGGTAWEHPNGLWVYITDATGKLVCDYRPAVATQIYQPLLPLRPTGDGKFRWHSIRGGS